MLEGWDTCSEVTAFVTDDILGFLCELGLQCRVSEIPLGSIACSNTFLRAIARALSEFGKRKDK